MALVFWRLTGSYVHSNQSLRGQFISISDGRIIREGQFTAIWINPQISGFAPAIAGTEEIVPPAVTEHMNDPTWIIGWGLPDQKLHQSLLPSILACLFTPWSSDTAQKR